MRSRGLLLAVASVAACSCTPYTVTAPIAQRPSRPAGERRLPPSHAVPAAYAPEERPLRVLLFGDFGEPTAQQRAVAEMMIAAHRRRPFDLAFSLGDNVYPCGLDVTSEAARACTFEPDGNAVARGYEAPRDARFEERFERPLLPFASTVRPLVVHGVLGNHDVASGPLCREGGLEKSALSRTRACLQVAQRSPVWRMPGRHYVVDEGPARFVVVDSTLLIADYGGFSLEDEIAFVREAVRAPAGRHVFIVAHHPAATAGRHRSDFRPPYLERLARLLEAAGDGVSAWLAGHDHVLQHARTREGLDVFVSGNGALDRSGERFDEVAPAGAQRVFGSNAWGFAVLEVTRSGWSVAFEVEGRERLHCCRAAGPGPCDPAPCAGPEAPWGPRPAP